VLVTRGGTKFGRVFVPGMEGTAAYGIAAVLALKGWRVRGVRGVDMPSNWTSLHPGYGPEAAGAIRDRNRPRVAAFAACLLEGRSCFRSLAPLVIGLALLPISAMYLALGRLFLAKLFFANEDCDLCGICVRHCAFGGVRWKGPGEPRPYWTFHCESCMRCMGYCPRGAVEAGHSLAVALYFLTAIPAGTWILAHAGEALGVPGLAGIAPFARVLDFLYAVLALWLAYGALHALLRFRWARWLLARTTFTHLYRRYHEHGTSLGSLGREEST
jgi:ferredoxin